MSETNPILSERIVMGDVVRPIHDAEALDIGADAIRNAQFGA